MMPNPTMPKACWLCKKMRWVLMGNGVWWCTNCDGPVPLPKRGSR